MGTIKLRQQIQIALIFLSFCGIAQDGMDRAGPPVGRYSKLRSNFLPFQQNNNNEKALGVYQSIITPQSFLEVNSLPAYMPFPMPGLALGEIFRTTSPTNLNSNWRMFTGTGAFSEKFRVTTIANTDNVSLSTVQNGFLSFHTADVRRFFVKNGTNTTPCIGGNNAGYIGVSPQATFDPLFNIDIRTPAQATGELFFGATPSDVPNSRAMIVNASSQASTFVPTFMGNLDASQTVPAISTLGNIDGTQDQPPGLNNFPVHRFMVGKGYQYYCNGVGNISEIVNRVAFTWQNAGTIKMMMNAAGRARIGQNLLIPANLPGNRFEITSHILDPYGPVIPTNGASGLRLTNLTSTHTPIANGVNGVNNTKVLTVDQNGDVVLVNSAGSVQTNNGISTNSLGVVQLGIDCPSPSPTTTAASQLINDRQIPMANFNFCFNNPIAPNTPFGAPGNRVGIGTNNCRPGNRLEVNRNTGTNPTSGLRLTDLAGATPLPTNNQVLSVDANGDVILTTVPTSSNASVVVNNGISINNGTVQLGIPCNSTVTPSLTTLYQLTTDRQIPMNANNFIFSNNIPNNTPFGASGDRVGIGTSCNPGNRLEVDRNTGLDNISGLRLTQFAAGAPTITAFQNRVLSVDASGDVILSTMVTNTSTGIGNYCNQPQNPLTGEFEVPLASFKYRFTGQGVITNNILTQQDMVSVGYPCNSLLPVAKFSVLEAQTATPSFDNFAGHFNNTNVSTGTLGEITAGVFGEAKGATPPSVSEPINSGAVFEGVNSLFNIGVIGRNAKFSKPSPLATGGYAIGGAFMSDSSITNPFFIPSDNYGVFARASGAQINNYGVYAIGSAASVINGQFSTGVNNFGVYAEAIPNSASNLSYGLFAQCLPTLGVGSANHAGYFSGDVFRTGNDNFSSDQILKQNIDSLPNAMGIINQLKPKVFNYNTNTYPQMGLPFGLQYGLIAQDVQTVVPELVNNATHPPVTIGNQTYSAVNYLTVEYQQFIPILIKAVQQLSAQNRRQDSLIQVLTQNINACCENNQARQTGIIGNNKTEVKNVLNIDLTDKDVIVLNQNVPNPFAERTTITYNVPEQYKFAQIIFKTVEGKIIRAVDIEKKGRGQLNVFADDLSNGLYMYSLIVDGVLIDTKKMIKQ